MPFGFKRVTTTPNCFISLLYIGKKNQYDLGIREGGWYQGFFIP